MKFKINPYKGAEPILLGMTNEQIEGLMGVKARKFKKTTSCETLTDAFSVSMYTIKPMDNAKQ